MESYSSKGEYVEHLQDIVDDQERFGYILNKYLVDIDPEIRIANAVNTLSDHNQKLLIAELERELNVNKGVMKFEKFRILESNDNGGIRNIIYSNIGDTNIQYDKILADFYHTSLGHIEEISKDLHSYKVTGISSDDNVIIFSDDDLKIITNNLIEYCHNKAMEETLLIDNISVEIFVKDVMDHDKFKTHLASKFDTNHVISIMSEILDFDNYTYEDNHKGFYIWSK